MADYDSDDDEAYFLDLVFRSADERDILERVREHETFKQFRAHAEKGYSRLTADQIDKALDLNVVKWSQFHLKVMQSVTDNRASNKTNASRRSISHMNTCTELKAKLCENYVEFVTEEMGNDWRSVVQTFACLFIHELERSANEAEDDLSKRIDEILEKPWKPLNDIHVETIYYIAGAMLNAAKNKIQEARTTNSLKNSLHTLVQNQSLTKKDTFHTTDIVYLGIWGTIACQLQPLPCRSYEQTRIRSCWDHRQVNCNAMNNLRLPWH
jgi:hypothetical protein